MVWPIKLHNFLEPYHEYLQDQQLYLRFKEQKNIKLVEPYVFMSLWNTDNFSL